MINLSKIDQIDTALQFQCQFSLRTYLLKPSNFKKLTSIWQRISASWDVFTGKRVAVFWGTSSDLSKKI